MERRRLFVYIRELFACICQLVGKKMSMTDAYFQKLSALNKEFERWMPFQPTPVLDSAKNSSNAPFPECTKQEKKSAITWKAGSTPTNKSGPTKKSCNFCRQNGYHPDYYEDHRLRSGSGRLECPILRAHVCEVCRATGDKAHTMSYCPVLKAAGITRPKTALMLKNTLYDSCGRRRRP